MKTKPPSPIDEVGQLREELAQERANNKALLKRVDELSRRVASLQEQLDQTMKMLRRRDEQVKRLERENRGLRRKLGLANPEPESEPDPAQTPQPLEGPTPPGACEPVDVTTSNYSGGAAVTGHSDGLPAEEPQEASPQDPRQDGGEEVPPVPTLPRPKPRPRSRGGRRPPPAHLPNDAEFHKVDACGTCGCRRVFKRDVLETPVYSVVPS